MSHLDEFKTSFKNKEAFVKALCRTLDLKTNQIEVFEKAQAIQGYHGTQDGKVGHIIIRKQHTFIPSDIGWEMKDGVLVSHVDAFDYCRLNKNGQRVCYDSKFNLKLTESYNFELSKMTFQARGIQCVECRDAKGRLQLKAKIKPAANKLKVHI
jgi:hypothetical protein